MPPKICHNHRATGKLIAYPQQMDDGCFSEMMSQLAHQDKINALCAYRRCPRTSDSRRNAARAREAGRCTTELETERNDVEATASSPADGNPGQVPAPGAEVKQRQSLAPGTPAQGAREPEPNCRGAAEPAVGPGYVAQGLSDRSGVGPGVIQQLRADGADRQSGHATRWRRSRRGSTATGGLCWYCPRSPVPPQ